MCLQGANLQGVKMLCTNAEGATLKGCNFEDPSGLKANLEGDPALQTASDRFTNYDSNPPRRQNRASHLKKFQNLVEMFKQTIKNTLTYGKK